MSDSNNNGCGAIVVLLGILTGFTMMVNSCTNSNVSVPSSPSSNTFEHRYVKERVKLEGYSDREAQQAADAIIKFHNAQQRNR